MSAVAVDPRVGGKSTRVAGRVAIYCRISRDGDGRGLGVERQREDCLRLAAMLGLVVDPADIIIENDTGASVWSTKPRPLYADLLSRVRSGAVTHVIAYSLSRLTRQMGEREDLLDLRSVGLSVTTVLGQRIAPDMSALEVQMLRMAGVNDTAESDILSERTRRAFDQNAQRGTPHGPIAYGWTRSRERSGLVVDTLDQDQADVIRHAAFAVLAGEPVRAIVRDLNARGVPAPRGGQWSSTILTKILLRERNAARRVHRGVVVGPAQWAPVYDDATHDAVVAYLRDPARVPNRGAQRHLLSGLLTCGRCGSVRMWVVLPGKAKAAATSSAYQCKDCHGIRRRQEPIDLYVVERVVERVAQPDALDWLADDVADLDAARASLAGLRGRADLLADMLAADEMTREQFGRANLRLQDQIADAERVVENLRPLPATVRGLIGHGSVEATRDAWDLLSFDAKRDAIRTLAQITILPTARRKFDPTAIRIDWKTTLDAA